MVTCFVPRCKSGYSKKKCHSFRPSTKTADQWVQIMRKLRKYKEFDPRNDNHRVCSLHFEESSIIKTYKHVIEGKLVEIPRDKWMLTDEAIPTIFEELPPSVRPKPPAKRRILVRGTPPAVPKKRSVPVQYQPPDGAFHPLSPPATPSPPTTEDAEAGISADIITKWLDTAQLDTDWTKGAATDSRLTFHCVTFRDDRPESYKTIVIQIDDGVSWLSAYVDKSMIKDRIRASDFPSFVEQMGSTMKLTEDTHFCQGVAGFDNINESNEGHKFGGVWRATGCEKIGGFKVCLPCKRLFQQLSRSSMKPKPKPAQEGYCRKKIERSLKYYKDATGKLRGTNRILELELRKMKSFVRQADIGHIRKILDEVSMPTLMKEAIVTGIESAKRKSTKGMRYSTCWLLECLLLRIKAPAAYTHLRESKVLQLPHPRTLRKLIAGQPCEFGINMTAVKSIQRSFADKTQRDRQGVLIFDEIRLRESLEFNRHTFQLQGYMDYGSINSDLVPEKDRTTLANHALVIMYRPLNDSWVQPVCAFATYNAAKGNAIHRVVMQTIIALESVGAEVLSVVCDGAKPNKAFWKLCGIGEKNGEIINKIVHPWDDRRFLYFTCDVPHIFKCIRNHILKYKFVSFLDEEIDFSYYENLFKEDQKRQYGLRKCPKLTRSHIWPNNFEKMNVPLVTQLFSRSVATGLSFYRQLNAEGFQRSESTERMTYLLNNVFDSLNASFPEDGVTLNSHRHKVLQNFYTQLCQVDTSELSDRRVDNITLASKETFLALKITIKSTLDIIDYLISERGFLFVLTGKLTQDCLEKFFGIIRAAGGREEHPTVTNFIQLFRLLSLYTPIKRYLRGNVQSDQDDHVLFDLELDFRQSARDLNDSQKNRSQEIDIIIMEKLLHYANDPSSIPTLNNDTGAALLDKNIVYHLSGYLCYRSRKLLSCLDCSTSLHSRDDEQSSYAILTNVLDYGSLCHPSGHFFNCVFDWEQSFCNTMREFRNNGDIILTCLKKVNCTSIMLLGCGQSDHNETLVKILLPYYLSMRIHFYTRAIRNELGRGKATKSKRKESKLLS